MRQILIADLNATERLTLVKIHSDYGRVIGERLLKQDDEDAQKLGKELIEQADEWEATDQGEVVPAVVIGYVPGPVKSRLYHEAMEISTAKERTPAVRDREDDLSREWIKYGVKGHENMADMPFESVEETIRGRTILVASENMIELYEQSDLLRPLEAAIVRFNTLSEKKSAKSSSTSGEKTLTSPVIAVPGTPR